MANTNTAISTLVSSQLPAFVRDDNPIFKAFLEAYYEYMEQKVLGDTGSTGRGKTIERLKALDSYRTLNTTLDDFKSQLYSEFMQFFPARESSNVPAVANTIIATNLYPLSDYSDYGNEQYYSIPGNVLDPRPYQWTYSGPDGTMDATPIQQDSAYSVHQYGREVSLRANTTYTTSWYMKPIGNTSWVQLRYSVGFNGAAGLSLFCFNGNGGAGNVGAVSGAFGQRIEKVPNGNGWYRLQHSITTNTIPQLAYSLFRMDANGNPGFNGETFQGDGVSGVAITGFQFEDTTATRNTAANGATARVRTANSAPVYLWSRQGEPAANSYTRNLAPRPVIIGRNYVRNSGSIRFDGIWGGQGTTFVANSTTGPDGRLNATRLIENVASSLHETNQTILAIPIRSPVVVSFLIKALPVSLGGAPRYCLIQYKDIQAGNLGYVQIIIDPATGTLHQPLAVGTGAITKPWKIEWQGDNWWKCSFTGMIGGLYPTAILCFFISKDLTPGGVTTSYAGDGVSGFYLKDPQVEFVEAPGNLGAPASNSQYLWNNNSTYSVYTETGNSSPPTFTYSTVTDYDGYDSPAVNLDKLLPRIKDFYRARGSEKSYQFLMKLVTASSTGAVAGAGDETSLYYPKDNILKASDGKWFVQKSLRVSGTRYDGNADSTLATLSNFTSKQIKGATSNTTATVERVEQFYELGTLINEIYLSSISNVFASGETVVASYADSANSLITHDLRSNIFSGLVTSVTITNAGQGYSIGDPVTFIPAEGDSGSGATAFVSAVSSGNVSSITVLEGGSGYRTGVDAAGGDWILITGGGGGSGANGNVLSINSSGTFHPNSYNLDANTILQISGATWQAAQTIYQITTSNLALNTINSLATTFVFKNTGPVTLVRVNSPGSGYLSTPTISVIPNTIASVLGVLGSLVINSGGSGYAVGEWLTFTTGFGNWGSGANANVVSVNGTGAITGVRYQPVPGQITGGSGYDPSVMPTVGVLTAGGTGANIVVKSVLGYGASLSPATGTIGAIQGITISSGGSGYTVAPTVSLAGEGDGTANGRAAVIQGVFTYPGYFRSQDGFPSAFNFLQDRDYFQNYSYVLRTKAAYADWIRSVNQMLHPSGTKVFGEYLTLDDSLIVEQNSFGSGYSSNAYLNGVGLTAAGLPANTGDLNFGFSGNSHANCVVFDGTGGIGFPDGFIGTTPSHGHQGSFWIWLPEVPNLPNVNSKMVLMEWANGNIYKANAAHSIYLGNVCDPNIAMGTYVAVQYANLNTGNMQYIMRTDPGRTPLQPNQWIHISHAVSVSDNAAFPARIYVNNVNSSISIFKQDNPFYLNDANLLGVSIGSFGCNVTGHHFLKANVSEFLWMRYSYLNQDVYAYRNMYHQPAGEGILPTSNLSPKPSDPAMPFGFTALAGQYRSYWRANTAAGNTNSGFSQPGFSVLGQPTTRGLAPGLRSTDI